MASSLRRQWIFGYGSLVHVESLTRFLAGHQSALGDYRYGVLSGFRRAWSVAMDNAQTLPGYKYYLDAVAQTRPEVFVAFANIERHDGASVSGILFAVDDRMLEVLDSRERNYRRTDITEHLAEPVGGTVWTYIGSPEARDRFQQGLRRNALVIDEAYLHDIEHAFARAGLPYSAPLPEEVAVRKLTRIDT